MCACFPIPRGGGNRRGKRVRERQEWDAGPRSQEVRGEDRDRARESLSLLPGSPPRGPERPRPRSVERETLDHDLASPRVEDGGDLSDAGRAERFGQGLESLS